jgi:transcriptional regulator with XRE-family HTH domain
VSLGSPRAIPVPEDLIAPGVLRHLRRRFELTPRQLAQLLRVGKSSIYRFETDGAPPWMLLALGGLGILRYGIGVEEIAGLMGLDPDAIPPRDTSGTFAPVVPTRRPLHLPPEDSERDGLPWRWPESEPS